jgi:hypothetical protein
VNYELLSDIMLTNRADPSRYGREFDAFKRETRASLVRKSIIFHRYYKNHLKNSNDRSVEDVNILISHLNVNF